MTRRLVVDVSSTGVATLPRASPTAMAGTTPRTLDTASASDRQVVQLAAELHDHFAQSLWCLDLGLRDLDRALERDPSSAREYLAVARRQLDDTYRDVRLLIGTLRASPPAELCLDAAIHASLRRFSEKSGTSSRFEAQDVVAVPGKLATVQLLAILEQALQNIRQHACASCVTVSLSENRSQWVLAIRDDGRGFHADTLGDARDGGHHGVSIMHDRARSIDGWVDISTAEGNGTTVRVYVRKSVPPRRRQLTRTSRSSGGELGREVIDRR